MVIADASVWVEYLRGTPLPEALWLREHLGVEEIGMLDLTLCEVLQGIRSDAEFRNVSRFFQARCTSLTTGGELLAMRSAENYRTLRTRGWSVRTTIDCLIATFCIMHGHALLHRDRDFDHFERHLGLRVVRP